MKLRDISVSLLALIALLVPAAIVALVIFTLLLQIASSPTFAVIWLVAIMLVAACGAAISGATVRLLNGVKRLVRAMIEGTAK